jgi:hypothetical protein
MALLNHRAYSHDASQDRFLDKMSEILVKRGFACFRDTYGNLLAERKRTQEYVPLVIAHVDINQPVGFPTPVEADGWIVGIQNGVQKGLGHDDRAGVYFALQVSETEMECKIILTKDEEIGAIGAGKLPREFFTDVSICIQLDRRGSSDISDWTNGVEVVSAEFKTKIKSLLKKYNYAFTTCMFTDVGELKAALRVDMCCMNISCGYYNEHFDSERLNWNQYVNACNFGFSILTLCGKEKQEHQPVVYKPKYNYSYGSGSYSSRGTAPARNQYWEYDPETKRILFLGGEEEELEDELESGRLPALTQECQHCGDGHATWNSYWQAFVCPECREEIGNFI